MDTSGVRRVEDQDSGSGVRRRRYRSVEEKRRIVEETLVPDASVAVVARRHGVNANQVFMWRRHYQRGTLGGDTDTSSKVTLVPVEVHATAVECLPQDRPASPRGSAGQIEIEFSGGRRLRVEGHADAEMLRTVIRELSQR